MATWRRKAIELFPELRGELRGASGFPAGEYTYYQLLVDLGGLAQQACGCGDNDTLDRIFQFARWCVTQGNRALDLQNAAVTVFFEHVFDLDCDAHSILQFLRDEDVRDYWGLWEEMTPAEVWPGVAVRLIEQFPDAVAAHRASAGWHLRHEPSDTETGG